MRLLILLTFVFFIGVAQAERPTTGFYVGAGLGQAYFDQDDLEDELDLLATGTTATTDLDDDDTGYKLYAGYNFTPNLGVEVTYYDLGELDGDITEPASGFVALDVKIDDINAFSGKLMARYPGEMFSVFGGLGIARVEYDLEATLDPAGIVIAPISASESEDDTVFTAGLGALWHANRSFALRGEWEYFDEVEEVSTNLFSLGAQYNF